MPRPVETAIGVDVGGTRIRAARIDASGAMLVRLEEPVQPAADAFPAQLLRIVSEVRDDSDVAIGVGLPGRVDVRAQAILSAGFLDIAGLDIVGFLRAETGLPVQIQNDATMALVAEAHGRPDLADVTAMITVGTGIGGAVLRAGAPWDGGGFAGQFGHIVVAPDGPACTCGRRGCVETFSSGTALGRLMAEDGWPDGTRAEDLLGRAGDGDARAAALLERWAAPLDRAIQSLVAVIDPRPIVVGGGLGRVMTAALARLPPAPAWFPRPVIAARLDDTAGVIGAGLTALDLARPA